MKPKIFPKPKIGKNKFEEILKRFQNIGKKEITLLKIPKEKVINISKERNRNYSVISILQKEKALLRISKKKKVSLEELKKNTTLFHTQIYRHQEGKISNGSAIPNIYYFFKSIINYPKINQKYQVIAVVNTKGKVIGYTTIKVNQTFMTKVNNYIIKSAKENKITLTESKNNFLRYFMNLLNSKENATKKRDNYKIDLYKLLESFKFEIYFTPETGYILDKKFNFIKKGKEEPLRVN